MVHPPATPVGETHGITVSRHAESIFDTFKPPRDRHIPQLEQRHRSEANFTGLMLFGHGICVFTPSQIQPSVASTPPTGVLLVVVVVVVVVVLIVARDIEPTTACEAGARHTN